MLGRIRQAWRVEPTRVYASTEVLYLASSIPPHPGLHVDENLAVVEVVDENDRPVPAGRPGHRVLVTNLVNRTQPLIRYEISDAVTLAEGASPCGLPYRRIAAVDGRSDDVLRFPAAGGGDVAVHPYRLRTPFAALDELRRYQIVQDDRGLEIRIVPRASAPTETPARVRAALVASICEAGALPPAVDVTVVDAIEREPGHAAKIKLVKKVASRDAAA